ncbi:MAG: hypothetical protein NC231_09305 [Bacillus sp. (in: Bacteria)]|nr:hypothetical protein [Bacillus sp. (in: firmicutes)]MCM1425478.1 hypothetical protein [Eubacterium sp.]
MTLHGFYDKVWQKKIPQLLFYLALTIELGMVIIDKSNYINPIEGQLFRITFVLFALKLLSTEYTSKERAVICFLEVIAIISYKATGKNDVIRIVTFVAACKGIPLKQMLRYAFYVTFAGCVGIILLSVTGIYGDMYLTTDFGREYERIVRKGVEETRYTLGMGHPNALSCMYLMLCAMGIYAFAKHMKWYIYLFLMLLNAGIYILTDSKTSMLITTCLILGAFIMTYCRFFREHWLAYLCAFLVFAVCIGFSVDAAANAQRVREAQWNEYWHPNDTPHAKFLAKIDDHINGRIRSLTNSANNDGTIETWSAFSEPNNMDYYFDMGWVKLFYRYGVVPGILYCLANLFLLWHFYRKRDAFGLVVFTILAVYSVVEAHLFSPYIGRNFLLMIMGCCFFGTDE